MSRRSSARARIGPRSGVGVGIGTASTTVHRLFNGDARGESQGKLLVGHRPRRLPPDDKFKARLLLAPLARLLPDLDSRTRKVIARATVKVRSEKTQRREQERGPG